MVYENLGVSEAIKRSTFLFKKTWGENVGAGFSFNAIGGILFALIVFWLGFLLLATNLFLFIALVMLTGSIIFIIISTIETVFLASSKNQYAAGIPVEGVEKLEFGDIFIPKI